MAKRKAVLFITDCEYGQSNVVLAVAHDLLLRNEVDVHIASWAALKPRILQLQDRIRQENPTQTVSPITFHNLPGLSMFESWLNETGYTKSRMSHAPGTRGAAHLRTLISGLLHAWNPNDYIALYDWCADFAATLDPAVIVLDPFVPAAHDMCRTVPRNYVVLSPCTLAAGIIPEQPLLAGFWKYPAMSSGLSYPVSWYEIPNNILAIFSLIYVTTFDPRIRMLKAARTAHGILGPLPTLTPWIKDVPHLCPSLPDIDLPMEVPANITMCGPITLKTVPLSQSDPELLTWLEKGPTIMVQLGTHQQTSTEMAIELAGGLRVILDRRPDIQVLWKLKDAKRYTDTIDGILGQEVKLGRVKIEAWINADPISILETGHIVCAVHHGGANSFFEAAWAGVPHVVLAQWYDTYDYACRAEYLGIGVYGNRSVAPFVNSAEFGQALTTVVGNQSEFANAMKERARSLGEVCKRSGGRALASEMITKLAH